MEALEAHHREKTTAVVSPSSLPQIAVPDDSTLPEVIVYGTGLVVSNDYDKEVWQKDAVAGNGTSAIALKRPFWKKRRIWLALGGLVLAAAIIGAVVGTRKLGNGNR